MIIALLLLMLLIYRINSSIKDREEKQSFIRLVIITAVILLSALAIFQAELYINGYHDGTAGSDMRVYYEQSVKMADMESGEVVSQLFSIRHAVGYIFWGAMVQKFTLFRNVIWIKISNIIILFHLLLSLYLLLRVSNISKNITQISVWLLAINGVILFTSILNLRDIIIMFLIIHSLLIMEKIFSDRRIDFRYLFWLVPWLAVICVIRIFTVFIVLAMFTAYLFLKVKSNLLRCSGLGIAILAGVLVFNIYFPGGQLQYLLGSIDSSAGGYTARSEVREIMSEGSMIKRMAVGSIRYVLLPTPLSYAALRMYPEMNVHEKHWYSGFIGDFLYGGGIILWWLMMPLAIMAITDRRNFTNRLFIMFVILAISHILMYGYIWGGAAGVRQKIPIYIVGTVFAVTKLKSIKTSNAVIVYLFLLLVLLASSSFWAYQIQ